MVSTLWRNEAFPYLSLLDPTFDPGFPEVTEI